MGYWRRVHPVLGSFVPLLLCALSCAQDSSSPFATHAHFSVDNAEYDAKCCIPAHLSSSLFSVLATIEAPSGPMRYSWLQLDFYSFAFSERDRAAARKGNREFIKSKWEGLYPPVQYTDEELAAARTGDRSAVARKEKQVVARVRAQNEGVASLQLAVDSNRVIREVNLTMPGYNCTIAFTESELKSFLQQYRFDGKTLRLKSKGSFVCDMKLAGSGSPKFGWDLDLTTSVFPKAPGR